MGSFTNYFYKLFETSGEREWENFLDEIPRLVTEEMNAELRKEITEDEIIEDVLQLGSYKAPGLDGFNDIFYQRFWNVIKEDVVGAMKNFFIMVG